MLLTPLNLTLVYRSCHVQEKKCRCKCNCKSILNNCGKKGCKCNCQLLDKTKFYRENIPSKEIDKQSEATANGLKDTNGEPAEKPSAESEKKDNAASEEQNRVKPNEMGKNSNENENTDDFTSPNIINGIQSLHLYENNQNEDSNGAMESNPDENLLENRLEITNPC